MMAVRVRRGRLWAVLSFVTALATILVTLGSTAWAEDESSLPLAAQALTSSITISADQLPGFESPPPVITGASAIVLDLASGEVLHSKASDMQRAMASTTKMMTAVIVIENMDLTTQITISENAASQPELEVWTKAGDVFSVEQLLYSLMVPSHNQAAVALAEGFPGGESEFVARMNSKAAELGMTNTRFVNPSGLDASGHYSTAADLAALARYAMTDERVGPVFRDLARTREYALQGSEETGTLMLRTSNELLLTYDWITGVKTGDTPNAKECLVASGTRSGVSILSVLLGVEVQGDVFTESRELLEYGFAQYQYATVLDEGAAIAEAYLPHEEEPLKLVAEERCGAALSKGQTLTATVVIDRALVLPVEADEVVGRVELSIDGQPVGHVDVVTARAAEKLTLGTKISRFFSGIF